MNKDIIIGHIESINGIDLTAKIINFLAPFTFENNIFIEGPKINSLIKTRIGMDIIICSIFGEETKRSFLNNNQNDNKNEIEKIVNRNEERILKLKIVGQIENNKMIYGLRKLPIVGAKIFLLNGEDNSIIFDNNIDEKESIYLGKTIFNGNLNYSIPINQIIPSHVGIFGNTGSGKSNTLTHIYRDFFIKAKDHDDWKILIFDLNNEYDGDAITDFKNKNIYTLEEELVMNKIRIDYQHLDEDIWSSLYSATEKTQKPVLSAAFKYLKKEQNYVHEMKKILIKCLITRDEILLNFLKRIFFDNLVINRLLSRFDIKVKYIIITIDNSMHDWAKKYYWDYNENDWNRFIDSCENYIKLSNSNEINKLNFLEKMEFSILFVVSSNFYNDSNQQFIMPLISRVLNVNLKLKTVFEEFIDENINKFQIKLFNDKKITVLQLSNVSDYLKNTICVLITNLLFKIKKKSSRKLGNRNIINIIVDEAHSILNPNININEETIAIFETIAKEGRKFDIFLTLATQRPSDLSETLISQMHNYLIHKLVNPNDLNKIRGSVSYLDENSLKLLNVMGPGECIASGTAFKSPTFIQVYQLEEKYQPNSKTIILFGREGIFQKN